MEEKKIGISRDLVIHPGETIGDVLEERGIMQTELATRTGVSSAYVSNVIAGKKDISANFAMGLEYALGVPKSFWLNLQANYKAELLELNKEQTIIEEERTAWNELKEVVKYLRQKGVMPAREKKDEAILSLRKVLQISNISNLRKMIPVGEFRMATKTTINPYVLGAWIRWCQIIGDNERIETQFDVRQIDSLIADIKKVMLQDDENFPNDLKVVMSKYGISFSVVMNFKGAPVQGYISQKSDRTYHMVLTIRGAFADIFWFSLFHEIGHIVNGDVAKNPKFIDGGNDETKEVAANRFASDKLLHPRSYVEFVEKGDFSIEAIKSYAISQSVKPYIIIGRLQKEQYLAYSCFSEYKLRYK